MSRLYIALVNDTNHEEERTMCPACIASLAWIAGGVGSTTAITTVIVRRLRAARKEQNNA